MITVRIDSIVNWNELGAILNGPGVLQIRITETFNPGGEKYLVGAVDSRGVTYFRITNLRWDGMVVHFEGKFSSSKGSTISIGDAQSRFMGTYYPAHDSGQLQSI